MTTVTNSDPGRTRKALTAALVVAVSGLALALLGQPRAVGLGSSGLVQPPGATFAAAFPGTPRQITVPVDSKLFRGAESVTEYYLTSRAVAIRSVHQSIAAIPSYLVVTAVFTSPEAAEAFVNRSSRGRGTKPVLVGNVAGYQEMTRAVSSHRHGRTQRNAFESALSVSQGDDVYLAVAFNRRAAAARAFTHSLELLPGAGSSPASGSAGGTAGPPLAQLGSTPKKRNLFHDAEIVGAILVGLLVVGIVIQNRDKFRPPHIPNKAAMKQAARRGGTYGAPVDAGPSAQFAWMYASAPPDAEQPPVAYPPPMVAAYPPPIAAAYPPPDPAHRAEDRSGEGRPIA